MKFIFQIRVKNESTIEDYVEAWKKASTVIQQKCGARGTFLHRRIGDPNILLAVAEWDSRKSRNHAMKSLRNDPAILEILDRHLEFGELSIVGEFEDPEWSVVPPRVDGVGMK